MRMLFVYLGVAFLYPLSFSALAGEPTPTAGEAAAQQESPTPTGAGIPSDATAPPGPHTPFGFTFYGRVNVSFDVGNQELTGAPCITAATPCAPPQGQLRWLPDVASNLSRLGVRGYYDLSGRDLPALFQLEAQVDVAATPGSKPNGNNDTINPGNTAVAGALPPRPHQFCHGPPVRGVEVAND